MILRSHCERHASQTWFRFGLMFREPALRMREPSRARTMIRLLHYTFMKVREHMSCPSDTCAPAGRECGDYKEVRIKRDVN